MEAASNLPHPEPGNKRLSLSRWLLDPHAGTVTFEGRARLPEGVAPPTDFPAWLRVEWEALGGGVYRYRGAWHSELGPDDASASEGIDRVHGTLVALGVRAFRCDRFTYETDDVLADGESIGVGMGAYLECVDGVPVAVAYEDDRDLEGEDAIAHDVKAHFGGTLVLGPWEHDGKVCRAPVVSWCP